LFLPLPTVGDWASVRADQEPQDSCRDQAARLAAKSDRQNRIAKSDRQVGSPSRADRHGIRHLASSIWPAKPAVVLASWLTVQPAVTAKGSHAMSFTRSFDARLLSAVAVAVFLIAPVESRAQESDPVVARANGVDIRQGDLKMAEDDIGTAMPQMGPDQKRDYLITYLADVIILAQAADQQQLANRNEVKHRIEFERHKALMEALLQDAGKAAMTDDAMRKIYDEAIKQTPNEEEVHARHILVATEGEAKDIEAQLKKGADFATLAKEKSKDPGAAEGGDLGYFTKEQMVPEFAEAAFKLEKGQTSDPVKTQFGWHVIKIEDKRIKPTPTFDQVKGQLQNYVARRAQAELVDNLRKSATIERLDQPAGPSDSSALNPAAPSKK
jgi:peptidyl-prolyl cis-trans isomerase C